VARDPAESGMGMPRVNWGVFAMRRLVVAAAGAAACVLSPAMSKPAAAEVVINVSKSSQRMAVTVNGAPRFNWLVSTGKRGNGTPSGTYSPQRLERSWYSRTYGNAPMPHSIFFYKGYAIHGTTQISELGGIASHGCVRLHPENAAKLFALVQSQVKDTRINVSDKPIAAPEPPDPNALVAKNTKAPAEPAALKAFARAERADVEPGFHW
jgi:lipoprotein-anchoring transpeptidase ErfK/SrfK